MDSPRAQTPTDPEPEAIEASSPVVVPPPLGVSASASAGASNVMTQPIISQSRSVESGPRGWTPELTIQAWKEGIAALIGVLLVLVTLWMAAKTWSLAGKSEISDAKDILQILLGLVGVVLGYYFGRIPADARAAQAQEQANAATAQAQETSAQADAIADHVEQVMNNLPTEAATRGLGPSVGTPVNTELKDIRDKLRSIARSGRKR